MKDSDPKNHWTVIASSAKYSASWYINFPAIKINNKAEDKTEYFKKCILLLENFLEKWSDFYNPTEMEIATQKASMKFSIKTRFDAVNALSRFNKKNDWSRNVPPSIIFNDSKNHIFMFDENAGKIIDVWYPDEKIINDENVRHQRLNEMYTKRETRNLNGSLNGQILKVQMDFWGGNGDDYMPSIWIQTNSDIWLYSTFFAGEWKRDNVKIAEINNERLAKFLQMLETKLGGEVYTYIDSYECGFDDSLIYKYGLWKSPTEKIHSPEDREKARVFIEKSLADGLSAEQINKKLKETYAGS